MVLYLCCRPKRKNIENKEIISDLERELATLNKKKRLLFFNYFFLNLIFKILQF